MHPAGIFDLICVVSISTALLVVVRGWQRALTRDTRIWLVGLLGLALFHSVSNLLEWSNTTAVLDHFEDYFTVLEPWMWGTFMYVFIREMTEKELREKTSERERVERDLRKSEEKFREIFHNANDAMYLHPVHEDGTFGHFLEVNRVACEMLGYRREELRQMSPHDIDAEEHREQAQTATSTLLKTRQETFEMEHVAKSGATIPVEISSHLFVVDGERRILSIARDITERRKAQKALESSLAQKDVLLREVHHRVKNNLQVINSLLRLQARQLDDESLSMALKETRNRIRAMALLHETLYRMDDVAQIDFDKYIQNLAERLRGTYGTDASEVVFRIQVENVSLGIEKASPCGQIISELVSNSLQHAFGAERSNGGRIDIRLACGGDDRYELVVADNGAGLPPGLEPATSDSLGLRLVTILAEDQLGGSIDWQNDEGARVRITFPGSDS
jgi:PAS domain S-box-containing protein